MSDSVRPAIKSPEGRTFRIAGGDEVLAISFPPTDYFKWHALIFVTGIALIAWKYDSFLKIFESLDALTDWGVLVLWGGVVCVCLAAALAFLDRFCTYVVEVDDNGIRFLHEFRGRRIMPTEVGFDEIAELKTLDHGKDARIQVYAVDSKEPRFSIGHFISSRERDWFLDIVSGSLGLKTGGHVDSEFIGEVLKEVLESAGTTSLYRTTPGSDTSPALKFVGAMLAGVSFLLIYLVSPAEWSGKSLAGVLVIAGVAVAVCICGIYFMVPADFAKQNPDGSLDGWRRVLLVFRREYHVPVPAANSGEYMTPQPGRMVLDYRSVALTLCLMASLSAVAFQVYDTARREVEVREAEHVLRAEQDAELKTFRNSKHYKKGIEALLKLQREKDERDRQLQQERQRDQQLSPAQPQ